jgi:hypothetical protein
MRTGQIAALFAMALLAGACAQSTGGCVVEEECPNGTTCIAGHCVPEQDVVDAQDVPDVAEGDPLQDDATPEIPPDTADTEDEDGYCIELDRTFSETQELFTIPAGVRYMHVKAWGAGGNEEHLPGTCPGIVDDGGLGGYSEAVFEVSPGTDLIFIVGKLGRAGVSEEDRIRFGFGNWGGGGLTGVFLGPTLINETDLSTALIIAGGGGGSGGDCANPAGTGNSAESGGQPTMQGGAGADDVNGGGGGYHGGTGGERGGPGMGGEGFVAESAIESIMKHSEPGAGVPPDTDDEDYDGTAGSYEQNGLLIIRFVCTVPPIL